jgi:hypothetical protein
MKNRIDFALNALLLNGRQSTGIVRCLPGGQENKGSKRTLPQARLNKANKQIE